MIYGQKPEMVWRNLLKDRCPRCRAQIIERPDGYECLFNAEPAKWRCKFFVTKEAWPGLIERIRNTKSGFKARRTRG